MIIFQFYHEQKIMQEILLTVKELNVSI